LRKTTAPQRDRKEGIMLRRPQPTTAPVVVIKRKIVKPASALPVAEKPSPPTAAVTKPPSANGTKKPTLAQPETVKPPPAKPLPAKQSPPVPPVVPIAAPVPTAVAAQEPATEPTQPNRKERVRAEANALLDVLADRFPSTFVRDWDRPVRPLAIGTRQALAALLPEEPPWKISRAIGAYISRVRFDYLSALVAGQPRVDLEGNMAGVPTEEEREIARTQLAAWQEKRRERKKEQVRLRRSELKSHQSGQADHVGAAVPKQNAEKAPREEA
jgi:sRNA-binding protein